MSVFISIVVVNILIKMYDYLTGFPALSQSGPSSPIYFILNTVARIHLPKILYVSFPSLETCGKTFPLETFPLLTQ